MKSSTTIQQTIKELLAKSEATELGNPQQSYVYAQEAHTLAVQHNLYYEHCLALLHLAGIKENLADNTNETETLLAQAIALAKENGFDELQIHALSKMASLLATNNRIDAATEYIEQAKQYLSALNNPPKALQLVVLYDDINIRYRKGEAGPSLLNDCLTGLQIAVELKNEGHHTSFLQMLTMLTTKMGDVEAGIKYSEQFVEIEEKRNFHMSLVGGYVYQSSLYDKVGRKVDALKALDKAVASSKRLGDTRSYLFVEIRRVFFLLNNQQVDEAYEICQHLLTLPELNEMPKVRFEVISALAQIAAAKNNAAYAIQLFETERKVFQEDKVILQKITNHLHELYTKIGNYQSAYSTLLENKTITQEIYDTEKTKEYAELHARFETKEKEAQLRETRLQKLDAELKAIKSQMNPHFVFNIMSTITGLMQTGKIAEAQHTLNQFSLLLRSILVQSSNQTILLEDEIAFLHSYLQLEKLSLSDKFCYEILCADEIDLGYEKIPSMLLQPIVENAIKHGLKTKTGEQKLSIRFSVLENQLLKIVIEDNGIGRQASALLNQNRKRHQSFAGKALEERIRLLNINAGYRQFEINFTDLTDITGNAKGTLVELLIHNAE